MQSLSFDIGIVINWKITFHEIQHRVSLKAFKFCSVGISHCPFPERGILFPESFYYFCCY